MARFLKFSAAVALGIVVGVAGLTYFFLGPSGLWIWLAVLTGEKIG